MWSPRLRESFVYAPDWHRSELGTAPMTICQRESDSYQASCRLHNARNPYMVCTSCPCPLGECRCEMQTGLKGRSPPKGATESGRCAFFLHRKGLRFPAFSENTTASRSSIRCAQFVPTPVAIECYRVSRAKSHRVDC